MITTEDVLTTCGRHPQRMEWVSPAVESNAKILAARISALFLLFGQSRKLTSGFRDMLSNKAAKGSSPYSRHQTGEAADIDDADGELGRWALANPDAIANCGLWSEPLRMTTGWFHVQTVPVPGGKRVSP